MKLIAESGSTKTDWKVVVLGGEVKSFSSTGINPTTQSSREIKSEQGHMLSYFGTLPIAEVNFYGAGCNDEDSKIKIKKICWDYFPNLEIEVNSDVLAASRALFGNGDGVACILGTGSNSLRVKGGKVIENFPSLGYLLGDEGGGANIGKNLIRDYLRNNMPADIKEITKSFLGKSHSEIIKKVYKLKYPNRYFARTVKEIIGQDPSHTYFHELINRQFDLFFTKCLLQYEEIHTDRVGFVGSIAYHFQDILKEVAERHRLSIYKIIERPIDELVLADN